MKDLEKINKTMRFQSTPIVNERTAADASDSDPVYQQGLRQAMSGGSGRVDLTKPSTTRKSSTSAEKITTKLLETSLAKLVGQSHSQHPANKELSGKDGDHASAPSITDHSHAEPNHVHHLRISLEPIRTQIISYLTLLRKMATNHP